MFTYGGIEIDTDSNTRLKNVADKLQYFDKITQENLGKDKHIIKRYAKRNVGVDHWLRQHIQHTNTLHKLAHTWSLDHAHEQKQKSDFSQH